MDEYNSPTFFTPKRPSFQSLIPPSPSSSSTEATPSSRRLQQQQQQQLNRRPPPPLGTYYNNNPQPQQQQQQRQVYNYLPPRFLEQQQQQQIFYPPTYFSNIGSGSNNNLNQQQPNYYQSTTGTAPPPPGFSNNQFLRYTQDCGGGDTTTRRPQQPPPSSNNDQVLPPQVQQRPSSSSYSCLYSPRGGGGDPPQSYKSSSSSSPSVSEVNSARQEKQLEQSAITAALVVYVHQLESNSSSTTSIRPKNYKRPTQIPIHALQFSSESERGAWRINKPETTTTSSTSTGNINYAGIAAASLDRNNQQQQQSGGESRFLYPWGGNGPSPLRVAAATAPDPSRQQQQLQSNPTNHNNSTQPPTPLQSSPPYSWSDDVDNAAAVATEQALLADLASLNPKAVRGPSRFLELARREGYSQFCKDFNNSGGGDDVKVPDGVSFDVDEGELFMGSGGCVGAPGEVKNQNSSDDVVSREYRLFDIADEQDLMRCVYNVNEMDVMRPLEMSKRQLHRSSVLRWPIDGFEVGRDGGSKGIFLSRSDMELEEEEDEEDGVVGGEEEIVNGGHDNNSTGAVMMDDDGSVGAFGLVSLARLMTYGEGLHQNPFGFLTFAGMNLNKLMKNLDKKGPITPTFAGPLAEHNFTLDFNSVGVARSIPEYDLPNDVCQLSLDGLRKWRESFRMKRYYLNTFQFDTLFYVFYSFYKDALQLLAGCELHRRGWRFHKQLQVWLAPYHEGDHELLGEGSSLLDEEYLWRNSEDWVGTPSSGNFIYFHYKRWVFDVGRFCLGEGDLEEEPVLFEEALWN